MSFIIGNYYKLDEIRKALGGPLLASFATSDNKLIYIKIKQNKDNPDIPDEILVRDGKIIQNIALKWIESKDSVPFFWRPKGNKESTWLYHGFVKPSISTKGKEVAAFPLKIQIIKAEQGV